MVAALSHHPGQLAALAALTEREIRVLASFYFDRDTQAAIAAQEGMSQTNVSAIINRAKRKLHSAGFPTPSPRPRTAVEYRSPDRLDFINARLE